MRTAACIKYLSGILAGLVAGCVTGAIAQTEGNDLPSPRGVVIGVKAGPVITEPTGRFPSLIIGESLSGSGERGSDLAETGGGFRWGLEFLFPFTPQIAVNLEIGSLHYVAHYGSDSLLPATRLDAQTVQVMPRLAVNLLADDAAFEMAGIRNVYVAGGLDLSLATVANRVEGAMFPDSLAPVVQRGSFASSEPFRVLVAVNGAAGMRIGVMKHLELLIEAGYSLALNKVFSSNVLADNDFTINVASFQAGIGYRF